MQYVLFVSDLHKTISILLTACFCSVSKLRNIVARDVFSPFKTKGECLQFRYDVLFPPTRREQLY